MLKVFAPFYKVFFPLFTSSSSTFTHEPKRRREWGWKKEKKIYFQHFQHNKINDLLLYHHNVLRNRSTGGWAALRLSRYTLCTYIWCSGGWACSLLALLSYSCNENSSTSYSSAIQSRVRVTKKYALANRTKTIERVAKGFSSV